MRKFLKELAPRAGVQLINYLKELDLQTALTAHIEGIGAFGALTNRPCERYCGLTLAPAYLSLKLTCRPRPLLRRTICHARGGGLLS